jgi:glycine hydroxymethyltransferase
VPEGARYLHQHSYTGLNRVDEIIAIQRGAIRDHIHLIASACYPFASVLRAMAEPSTLLPAEGMPGERYLPGADVMDVVETEGEQLALRLFGNPSGYRASLQPHSGTQANQIVYNAVLQPDDTVACLNAKNGGHISHSVLISRRHRTFNYDLTDQGLIDYGQLEALVRTHKPKLIIVGGSALPRQIDFAQCSWIARDNDAYLHVDISHTATFLAAGLHAAAFPYCDFATFNTSKNLRGPNAGIIVFREDYTRRVHNAVFPTTQGGANEPHMLAKFTALSEWAERDIKTYAANIVRGSRILSETLTERQIRLVTGGTDCHLILLDLRSLSLTGAELERKFQEHGVLLNRNLIPGDARSPLHTSGLRIGSANLAILGYEDTDIRRLGHWIADLIDGMDVETGLIRELLSKYTFPQDWFPP